jgi:hypothetical protein
MLVDDPLDQLGFGIGLIAVNDTGRRQVIDEWVHVTELEVGGAGRRDTMTGAGRGAATAAERTGTSLPPPSGSDPYRVGSAPGGRHYRTRRS